MKINAKKKKLQERCRCKELDQETRKAVREIKASKQAQKLTANKISVSVSFGISKRDIETTIKRFIARHQIEPNVGGMLMTILCTNIRELEESDILEMNYTEADIDSVKNKLIKKLFGRLLKQKLSFKIE